MKEIIAVIRPEKWEATKKALEALDVHETVHVRVLGRGHQRGLRYLRRPTNGEYEGMEFLPKRMVTWLVPDETVRELVATVIRVNQIEVTRTRNAGFDEYDRHTPENVLALRQALAEGWPGAPMTWAFSWRALNDERERYATLRRLIPEFHDRYGDDVTFIPGAFFANAYNTRRQVNLDLHEGLARVSEIMGGGFRPKSVIAGSKEFRTTWRYRICRSPIPLARAVRMNSLEVTSIVAAR